MMAVYSFRGAHEYSCTQLLHDAEHSYKIYYGLKVSLVSNHTRSNVHH